MAAAQVARKPGLARAFAEFPVLGHLLARPVGDWEGILRGLPSRPRSDHVEDGDLDAVPQDIVAQMALDAVRLCLRIGLMAADGTPTAEGRRLAGIAWAPDSPLSREDDELLMDVLARQVRAHYRGREGLDVTDLLQGAARRVADIGGPWAGHCPGLLLGELRHLLTLAHHDAAAARSLAERLPSLRAAALGRRRPGRTRNPTENLMLHSGAVNALHLERIDDLDYRERPLVATVTEARATGMLLDCAGLLRLLHALGPVQCLGAPDGRPARSPLDPVPLLLGDRSLWDRSMQAGAVAVLMKYLMKNDRREYRAGVGTFTKLGIDTNSREATGNQLEDGPGEDDGRDEDDESRRIGEHNTINKALAMELLTGLLLARLDTPRQVQCHCETRAGQPHKWAPPGLTDVEAAYIEPPPGFRLVAEVSAKSEMSEDDYWTQLDQAFEHAKKVAKRTGGPVYALVLNSGRFATNRKLQKTFSAFAKDKGLGSAPVRVVPMWGMDFAIAMQDLERDLEPEAFRFGNDGMREALDLLAAGAVRAKDEEKLSEAWMRRIWAKVATRQRRLDDPRESGLFGDPSPG